MKIEKRFYWAIALVAVLALAGTAVTVTSRLTSAGGSTPSPSVSTCDQQDEADDAAEAKDAPDTDNIEEQCGPQDEADGSEAEDGSDAADANEAEDGTDTADANETEDGEAQAPSGTLDDGKDLLPQAKITVDAAVAAAQSAASGSVGEVDLEQWNGKLVFNVDIGDKDVKVDANDGSVLASDTSD